MSYINKIPLLTNYLAKHLVSIKPVWLRFIGSSAILGVAISLVVFFDKVEHVPMYSILLSASVFTALLFGLIPSLIVGVLSALIIDYFFEAPLYQIFDSVSAYIRFFTYFITSSAVGLLVHSVRDSLSKTVRMNTDLLQLSAQKDRLMAMVAHDLRNPIGAILTMVDSMEIESSTQEEIKSDLKLINEITQLSLSIIGEIQIFANLEDLNYKIDSEKIDMNSLLENVILMNQAAAKKKNIKIGLHKNADLLIVHGDKMLLHRALQNLIDNAIKYSNVNTTVQVSLTNDKQNLHVAIEDNGLGISLNEQKDLFQPFYRTSNIPTAGESSTGLGLASVAKIIKMHSGQIHVKSQKGEGSTFTVSLPKAAA